MKSNLAKTDRLIRLIAGLIIAVLFITNVLSFGNTLGIIIAVAGAIFLFTAIVNWCAIYQLLGFSTKKA